MCPTAEQLLRFEQREYEGDGSDENWRLWELAMDKVFLLNLKPERWG